MSFINSQEVQIAGPLKAAHYELSRATALRDAFSRCVTDYYTKASSRKDFEANGLLVTGKSRVGKTRELKHLITEFNEANEKNARWQTGTHRSLSSFRKGNMEGSGEASRRRTRLFHRFQVSGSELHMRKGD